MDTRDKLIIETPEQTILEFPLAGIGSRALALGIDSLLQGAALAALGVFAAVIGYEGYFPQFGKQIGYAILIFIGFSIEIGYFALFETIWNGQTPGKRWTHLRVITDTGRPVDAQAAILRNLLRIVDTLPSLYAAGIITSLISPQNKRIGDYVAGTVVIHEKASPSGAWAEPLSAPAVTAAKRIELSPSEMQLVETFLARRETFPEDVRRSMAQQIAGRVSQGKAVSAETLQSPEQFLETLAEQYRSTARFR